MFSSSSSFKKIETRKFGKMGNETSAPELVDETVFKQISDSEYILSKSESNRYWVGVILIIFMLMWLLSIVSLWVLAIDQESTSYIAIAGISTLGGLSSVIIGFVWSFKELPSSKQYVEINI